MTTETKNVLHLVEEVIRIPDLHFIDLSHDGKTVVTLSNRSGSYQLWTIPSSGGELKQITKGVDRVTYAEIAHNCKEVAFARDFEGRELHQIFRVPLTGEETKVSHLEDVRVFDFTWSPTDDRIALTGATMKENALWVMNLENGRTEQIYRAKHWVFGANWSKDGTTIAVAAKTTDHPVAMELVTINLEEDSEVLVYTPKPGSENSLPKWSPRGQEILFKTDSRGKYELAVYDPEKQTAVYLKAGELDLGFDFPSFGWMPDGEEVWYLAAKNGRTRMYLEQVKQRRTREIPVPEGYHMSLLSPGPKVAESGDFCVFSWSSLSNPHTLSRYNFHDEKVETLSTCRSFAEHLPLGEAKHVTYSSFDALTIHGFLLERKKDVKAPCVLWIHGGPAWEVADEWNPVLQAFVAAGYIVFAPNIRGSTGYGVEFQNMNIRDLGGNDLRDVVAAKEWLGKLPEVDYERISIVGASYGGFMTFLAMTKEPKLWRSGVAIVGITDWAEMYELSDAAFRSFIERYMGRPEESRELYRYRSPITFVNQVEAPLFIWHRAQDSRTPLKPVQKFVEKLKEQGKKHEFHVVRDEGHGPQKLENLVKQYRAAVDFLNRVN